MKVKKYQVPINIDIDIEIEIERIGYTAVVRIEWLFDTLNRVDKMLGYFDCFTAELKNVIWCMLLTCLLGSESHT